MDASNYQPHQTSAQDFNQQQAGLHPDQQQVMYGEPQGDYATSGKDLGIDLSQALNPNTERFTFSYIATVAAGIAIVFGLLTLVFSDSSGGAATAAALLAIAASLGASLLGPNAAWVEALGNGIVIGSIVMLAVSVQGFESNVSWYLAAAGILAIVLYFAPSAAGLYAIPLGGLWMIASAITKTLAIPLLPAFLGAFSALSVERLFVGLVLSLVLVGGAYFLNSSGQNALVGPLLIGVSGIVISAAATSGAEGSLFNVFDQVPDGPAPWLGVLFVLFAGIPAVWVAGANDSKGSQWTVASSLPIAALLLSVDTSSSLYALVNLLLLPAALFALGNMQLVQGLLGSAGKNADVDHQLAAATAGDNQAWPQADPIEQSIAQEPAPVDITSQQPLPQQASHFQEQTIPSQEETFIGEISQPVVAQQPETRQATDMDFAAIDQHLNLGESSPQPQDQTQIGQHFEPAAQEASQQAQEVQQEVNSVQDYESTPIQVPNQPNWYPDPRGQFEYRWFDGNAWTQYVSVAGEQMIDQNPI